jgi:site-specific DNA recombinase
VARVGIYLRISDDPDGTETATKRQLQDCEVFCRDQDWEVADVFKDADLSAYRRGVRRPEFERLLQAVREKQIDGVVAWKIDRIARQQRDLGRLNDTCEDSGAFIATKVDGIDTRTQMGRLLAELLVTLARSESESQSIRLRRKVEEQVREGRAHTGGTRMFGYTKDRSEIVPEEAELVREAKDRILAGESLRGVCRDWEARGVRTPTGGSWRQITIKRMLTSWALAGQREHRGELSLGKWPAILTEDETRRLRGLLNDPSRTKVQNARRYLLTGFLKCGNCSQPLVARPRLDGTRRYVCARQPGNQNCGKLARMAEPVEQVVKEAVLVALDGVDLRQYVERPDDGTAKLLEAVRRDEERLVELSKDHYVDGVIGRAEYFAARDAIQARLDGNRRRLEKANGHGVLNQVMGAGEEVRKRWDDKGLDWQRAVIGALVDHVTLAPAVRGRNVFDPKLVQMTWKF